MIVSEDEPSVDINYTIPTGSFDTKKILKYLDDSKGNRTIRWVKGTRDTTLNTNIVDHEEFTFKGSGVSIAGYIVNETEPATNHLDEGDAGAARMSVNRNIYTQIRDGTGSERE